MAASYTKLRDGSWGVRVDGTADTIASGQTIMVRKKDGTEKPETVSTVLWTDGKIVLATIVPTRRPATGHTHTTTGTTNVVRTTSYNVPRGKYECDECGDFVTKGSRCWETGMTH